MKLFITGATGYIGKVVVEHAVRAGHTVEGLARNQDGATKLQQLGAKAVIGDLSAHEVLTSTASRADAVIHLAYIHDWSVDYNIIIDTEAKAVAALAAGVKGKPIITTSGTAIVRPAANADTDETTPVAHEFVLSKRAEAERRVLDLVKTGAHIVVVRLPPYVYGRGGSYFVPALITQAAKHGVSAWPAEGAAYQTSAIDVDDTARLYLAIVQKVPAAGSVFNGTGEWNVPLPKLAEAVGHAVGVPARSLPRAEVEKLWGPFLAAFVAYDNRASGLKAQRELGWKPEPKHGILDDIVKGSYAELAKKAAHDAKQQK